MQWPSSSQEDENQPTLAYADDEFRCRKRWPISITYFENINTDTFWQTYVRK